MKATIFFADTQVKEAFEALRASTRSEDRELVALLERAFVAISANAFCGTQVPKRQIPKNYLQRHPPDKEPLEVQPLSLLETDVYRDQRRRHDRGRHRVAGPYQL